MKVRFLRRLAMELFALMSIIIFIYGTIIGSFLNVVIYRVPKKEQIVKGRSRCPSCENNLEWHDMFPILSWVALRGKCRQCSVKISPRYALVELLCGVLYFLAFIALGLSWQLGVAVILLPVLICVSFIDADTGEIPHTFPFIIAVLGIFALILSISGYSDTSWQSHLLGAVIVSVPFAILAFFGAMGGGDVMLMASAGLLLGWNIIPAALIGVILGSIVGAYIKFVLKPPPQRVYSEEELEEGAVEPVGTVMRFGPLLAIGIAVGFLYGSELIEWYRNIVHG